MGHRRDLETVCTETMHSRRHDLETVCVETVHIHAPALQRKRERPKSVEQTPQDFKLLSDSMAETETV